MHFIYQTLLSIPQDNRDSSHGSQTAQGETDRVSKTLHKWVPPICHQPALQFDMQPLFICKPEGILTVTVFGKSLRNQLGLQKWNTLIPGAFAHAMALNVKESKAFDSPSQS